MTVLRLFQRAQLGEGLADLREIKKWIVSESVLTPRRVQDDAFHGSAKGFDITALASHSQDADEARGAFRFRNPFEFAQHTGVVGFVIGVAIRQVRLIRGIAGGMNARRSTCLLYTSRCV